MIRAGARAVRGTRAPLVLDRAPDDGCPPRTATQLHRERRALRVCSAVITASETDAKRLHERHRLSSPPVVYRELPPPRPHSPTPANLRQRLALLDRPLVLLHGDEPSTDAGLAMVRALAGCPDVHLAALGADRWQFADTIALEAERLKCAGRFHLLRGVPPKRIPAYAREADVGLCLSSSRPATMLDAICQYANAGLPVIVPPGSEGERVIERFGSGWIGDPDDHQQLAAVLELACGAERGSRREAAARVGTTIDRHSEAQILVGVYHRMTVADERVLSRQAISLRRAWRSSRALAGELRHRLSHLHGSPRAFAHQLWGRRLHSRGDYSRSITHYETALRQAPADPEIAEKRAVALKDAGRSGEAINAFRELLEAQADKTSQTSVNAAINLARLGVRREPREMLDRLIATNGTAVQLTQAAELAVAIADLRVARDAIERAVQIAPADPAVRKAEARVLEQLGEPARALASARGTSDADTIARLEGAMRVYATDWLPTPPSGSVNRTDAGRVLHLLETSLPHATTGYSYRTATVLAAQRMAGLEPIAATRLGFPANRGIHEFAATEVVDGVIHHRFTLPGVRRYTAVPPDRQLERNVELLGALAESIGPDVIHAATPHHNGLLGLSLRSAFGIPLLYEARGFPEMTWAVRDGGEESSVYGLRRHAETRCMLQADAVVTLSEVMRAHIVDRGVPPERVWVVPHMVDVEAIAPCSPPSALVRRYNLDGRLVVGYLGTLVGYEGIDLLLDALARLRGVHPQITGLIVGGGPAEPELRARAKELELDQRVIFAGRIPHDEVNDHVALFDIYALPRHGHEVCRWVTPLKPYEAMAAGSCMLTSDVEALAETASGGCGVTFPAGDAEALVDAVMKLAADAELRLELGKRAREKVIAHHSRTSLGEVAAAPARTVMQVGVGV